MIGVPITDLIEKKFLLKPIIHLQRVVHIIGMGPVGLFTAYSLLHKDVHNRLRKVILYESRSEQESFTRVNVIFINKSNPILKHPIIVDAMLKYGLCGIKPVPPLARGAKCFNPRRSEDIAGYSLPINYIQKSILNVLNDEFAHKIEFKYNSNVVYDEHKKLFSGLNFYSGDIIIDATGGRSPITNYDAEFMKKHIITSTGSKFEEVSSVEPDAYGMTLNFPCSLNAGNIIPVTDTSLIKDNERPQHNYRFLPGYMFPNKCYKPKDISNDETSYSYYLGINLTKQEYEELNKIVQLFDEKN